MMHAPCPARNAGVSLVEMIMAILLTSILAAIVTTFISRPLQGHQDLSNRVTLVNSAEISLRRMTRDLRSALPNSVRIINIAGGGFALEMLPVVEGGKYCTEGSFCKKKVKNFESWVSAFDYPGCFRDPALIGTLPSDLRVVINNLGTPGDNVYEDAALAGSGPGVISTMDTIVSIGVYSNKDSDDDKSDDDKSDDSNNGVCGAGTPPDVNLHRVSFDPKFRFKGAVSTNHRFFFVRKPVTYLCDPTGGQLRRYADYPIQAAQPATATVLNGLSGVSSALITDNVDTCSIATSSADVRDRSILTIALGVAVEGEKVSLMRQVALDNSR
jgi:MSHA biogenesis protein MshO